MPNELGDFLRARRTDAGLEPPNAGSPRRRRVTGLRREEVAAASGISADYYTRLEQGRETHPSDAVLDALARVLRLGPDAREHLSRLRGSSGPAPVRAPEDPSARERMDALVEAVRPNPAYVLDRLGGMIAANPEGLALYPGFAELPRERRNTCRYLMTDPRAREMFVEWEEIARGAVAHLRAANVDDLQDPALQRFVAELRSESPLFEEWWTEHIVERRRTSVKHVRTGTGEVLPRRHEVLYLPEDGLRMTIWLAAD
ncbi:helix-turn-helix transcriptional regulator [Microbacterium capsulatum]|uniref:Helix-turn-helix transcriptional regulator n=1 Tax=Microbacterium capsulatum TaxID=3041921 RepID=A0ABU0XJZ4_9MICO|nr:helix-turn-helix transcriptional regulator [Microbacterium sp. ASV81]MDQ4215421.1 helix-turn-helix transcriptional regulator [Microbacterium sp. ASV81]